MGAGTEAGGSYSGGHGRGLASTARWGPVLVTSATCRLWGGGGLHGQKSVDRIGEVVCACVWLGR